MSTPQMTDDQIGNMSDEDFLNMAAPSGAVEMAKAEEEEPAPVEPPAAETPPAEPETSPATEEEKVETGSAPAPAADPVEPAPLAAEDDKVKAPVAPAAPAAPEAPKADKSGESTDPKKAPAAEAEKAQPAVIDYKAAYEKIMGPFKANGKEIQLKDPEEAIRLMQQGANYTKKLQALQPNLKLMRMLENNGLLDESKLTFLIDLDRKDPAAIQKFIKESGVDPMDIDTSVEPSYKPGNHSVSDAEMVFTQTLQDVMSEPTGKNLVVNINQTWDDQSKRELYNDPSILPILVQHKQNGIYEKITSEIERRAMLGQIPSHKSFLSSYTDVGKEMTAQGAFNQAPPAPPAPTPTPQPQVLDTRVQAPKPIENNDLAKAASVTKATGKTPPAQFNPLAMSDEDFLKNAELATKL